MADKTSGTVHVYSTLPAGQTYLNHIRTANDLPVADGDGVKIKGGHGIAHQDAAQGLYTPMGVRTEISAEQLRYLRQNSEFNAHERRGYIKVMDSKVDPEKAVGDMQTVNPSRQLTDADLPDEVKDASAGTTKAHSKK